MVFACRCLSLLFRNTKYEATIQTKSTSVELFYTAHTDLTGNRSAHTTITDGTKTWDLPNTDETPTNLRVFTLAELKLATQNFDRSMIVGEGGFGDVYKGVIKSLEHPIIMIEVAVKKHNAQGTQGHKEWVSEVKVLGKIEHPNLVKLIGYCVESDVHRSYKLLVYEYMRRGSVHLHLSSFTDSFPSWALRLRIALDTARGLAYLHEGMDYPIIMRDFKSSNVLLDEKWNSKLSDFGHARLGPLEGHTHVTTEIVGTYGYSAPEYLASGHLTTKCDAYSYGVFLYVLITGKPAGNPSLPENERRLQEWVKPYLMNAAKFNCIVDPRIRGHFPLKSAKNLSKIAEHCLLKDPKSRPSMSTVFDMICNLVSKFLKNQSSKVKRRFM